MAKFWSQLWDTITGQPDLSDYWDREVQAKREAAWAADDKQAADIRDLNRKAPKAPRKGRTSKFTPDTSIAQLAYNAANWLADNHPNAVAKVGRPVFLAQRVNEILAGQFPEQYWDPCPMVDEQTMKATPTINYDAPQPPEKFITPASRNTICTYTTCSPSTGNASNAGYTNPYGYFVDLFCKQKNYKFQIPPPPFGVSTRPLFSSHKARWDVSYSHDNRQSFSNLYKCSLAASPDAFRLESEAVDQRGRFYYWHKKCPPLDPATLQAHMERSFIVDAAYKKWDDGYQDHAGGYALIQVAPAPPRGTYRYLSLTVFVDQSNEIALHVARPEIDDTEPTPSGFIFQYTNGSGYSYRNDYQPGICADQPWEIFGTPTIDGTYAAGVARAVIAWNKFFVNDRFPGWPASVTRHTKRSDNQPGQSNTGLMPYGMRRPWSDPGEQSIYKTTIKACDGDSRSTSVKLEEESSIELAGVPHGTPNNYFCGAGGWSRWDAGRPSRLNTDAFRVTFSADQFTISWNWPGSIGSKTWRTGDPFFALPTRPAPPA